MTDVKALLGQLRSEDPRFDEAQAVVDLVRSAADLLVAMRERAGWTQAQLADYLGVTVGRVSQLESGALRHAPSLKMMARIAHACGDKIELGHQPQGRALWPAAPDVDLGESLTRELGAFAMPEVEAGEVERALNRPRGSSSGMRDHRTVHKNK